MKMNKTSVSKSTSDNLIDLYTRIPDYSEVQHLGQSDFINTLEKLKEEFRQCRASLYNEEFCSDSEYLAGKSSPINSRSKTSDNLYYYSSSKFANTNLGSDTAGGVALTFSDGGHGKITKINNHNLTSTAVGHNEDGRLEDGNAPGDRDRQYLSIKSCELHRTPYRSTSASSLVQPSRYLTAHGGRSPFLDSGKNDSAFHDDDYDDDDDDEGYGIDNLKIRDNDRAWSVGTLDSDASISKWSSSPEIYRSRSRSKEILPPGNVQQRLLQRKSRNHSAPSVAFKVDQSEDVPKTTFKANPVPDHVYKPLYEFIMLKNQRRSERIREQSKRRLLSQVKPFSFCKDSKKASSSSTNKGDRYRSLESLNNTKPLKKRRNDTLGNIKTNNNRLNSAAALFRAKPAPPRTKALLAAIKQKEQQEYRELKKRLRSELLLKNASLPPSMAAREKRTKLTNAKLNEVLLDYQKSFAERTSKGRNYRETSAGTDDTALLTDDDRMTDEDLLSGITSTKKITTAVKPFKFSQRTPRKFTSFGTSRHSAAATGVFEASSNDNHASRLRYEASKIKEHARIQREEEEMLRIMKAERRRQKLRDCHLHAWQHAYSYSAEQDIAMRRQLRHAASILERETYVRDMSCMLSRVRSAPLLLEGGHRLERKQEPCRKHREEFRKLTGGTDRPWNKLSTPRLYGGGGGDGGSKRYHRTFDRFGEEKSETAAMAEGSLSNSDNESDGNDENGDGHPRRRRRKGVDLLVTDSGSSDLEEDDYDNDRNNGNSGGGVRTSKDRAEIPIPVTKKNLENDNQNDGKEEETPLAVDNDIEDEAGEDDEEQFYDGEGDGGNNGRKQNE